MNDARWISFGGSRVHLVCRHLDWGPSVDFLLATLPQGAPGQDALTTLTLSRSEADGTWAITETVAPLAPQFWGELSTTSPKVGGRGAEGREPLQSVLAADSSLFGRTSHLLGRICHGLADQSGPGVLFHAGAVAWGGRRIVIPGGVGRGKSTLTAWLALHGGRYLSDELVYWPSAQEPFAALARPLNLRWAGWQALLPGLTDEKQEEILARSLHQSGEGVLVLPPPWPAETSADGDPSLLLFPHFQPKAPLTLTRLSPARAGKALMESLVNGRNLPDHGFGMAVKLAAHIPAWRLTYGDFDQLDDAFWTQLRT